MGYEERDRGYGWVTFAGVLLLILGTLNTIEGIAAIGNAHFFHSGTNTHYIMGSLNTYGWVLLCLGVFQLAVGFGVFFKNQFSRWVGVVVLGCNAIAQLLFIPRLSVLVADDVHAGHLGALRTGRLRQANRLNLIEQR